jgi:hypothetical protein
MDDKPPTRVQAVTRMSQYEFAKHLAWRHPGIQQWDKNYEGHQFVHLSYPHAHFHDTFRDRADVEYLPPSDVTGADPEEWDTG